MLDALYQPLMRYAHAMRLPAVAVAVLVVVGCAGSEASKATSTPAGAGSSDGEFPQSVVAARGEVDEASHQVDASMSDCQAACKALASLERAANRLCMVAEPQECSDARMRVDRAKRAVTAQCGGC
jgi:hypothetical protein